MRLLAFALILAIAVALCAGSIKPHPADHMLDEAAKLIARGERPEGLAKIDSAISLDPSRQDTYLRAISILDDASLLADEARVGERLIKQISTTAKGTPDYELAEVYVQLGQVYFKLGNGLRAAQLLEEAPRLAPDNPTILNDVGYILADHGINLPQALQLTSKASRLKPGDGTILDSVGWAHYKLGDYASAVNTLKRAVKLNPSEAEIRYHLGAAYAKSGQPIDARIELRKSVTLDRSATNPARAL